MISPFSIFMLIIVISALIRVIIKAPENKYSLYILASAGVAIIFAVLQLIEPTIMNAVLFFIGLDIAILVSILGKTDNCYSNIPIVVFILTFIIVQLVAYGLDINFLKVASTANLGIDSLVGQFLTIVISFITYSIANYKTL